MITTQERFLLENRLPMTTTKIFIKGLEKRNNMVENELLKTLNFSNHPEIELKNMIADRERLAEIYKDVKTPEQLEYPYLSYEDAAELCEESQHILLEDDSTRGQFNKSNLENLLKYTRKNSL